MNGRGLIGLWLAASAIWTAVVPAQAVEKVYIDLTVEQQVMDGTGGNLYSYVLNEDPKVMDLIKNDMSLTHMRIRMFLVDAFGENGWEPVNDNTDPNIIDPAGFMDEGDVHLDFLMLKELQDAGIEPIMGIFDVPDWMVSNPNATSKRLMPAVMYPEFAEFVVSFILHARDVYGVDIHFVEIQNEPNIGWRVLYTPQELAMVAETLIAALDAYGLNEVNLVVGNVNKPTPAIAYWDPSLVSPIIRPRTEAVAYHAWEDMTKSNVEALKTYCLGQQIPCWSTEVGYGSLQSHTWGYAAGSMMKHHQTLIWSNATLMLQWTLAGAEGAISPQGDPYPIFHLFKHYTEHIEPGSIRVDTHDASGTRTTAFLNKAHRTLSIVTINEDYARDGRFIITSPEIEFTEFTVYKSRENLEMHEVVDTVAASNNVFNYPLDPNAYYTFVATYTEDPRRSTRGFGSATDGAPPPMFTK